MTTLAPGSVLQQLHFKSRLRMLKPAGASFYEVGAGRGHWSHMLLGFQMRGEAFDLNPQACAENRLRNRAAIAAQRYRVRCEDFLAAENLPAVDLIVCSMVLEHWPEDTVRDFLGRARELLTPQGVICIFVPGSPCHWGIEDEISGHLRRYTFESFERIASEAAMTIRDLRGLTYPLSNFLLPLSNWLVRRGESDKLSLTCSERTVSSGARTVPFKTVYPNWIGLVINQVTLYPFHLCQRLAKHHPDSMVIYCEMTASAPHPQGH